MASVAFDRLTKRYGATEVVRAIDLTIDDGEFIVLVGPSGCGKSTSLRMLAGLEDVSGGEIRIGGRVVNDVDARDRDVAMVFQDYALYPHMSVYDNMAFSLRYRNVPKREIRTRVDEVAAILGLAPLLTRRPKELSGGQRQRVAMGRAIVRQPQVFLFDEPLSNLDAKLRSSVRLEIKRLHQRLGITTVYVTHDQVEAMTLADRVVVMNAGRIEQVGTPDEVYHTPRTLFVAGFIGSPTMNILPAVDAGDGRLRLGNGSETVPWSRPLPGGDLRIGFRPEDIALADGPADGPADGRSETGCVRAVVDVVEPLGADTLVFANVAGHSIVARLRPEARPALGEALTFRLDLSRAHLFDAASGQRAQS